jgi:energy-coupling factor transport system substrate-specific component
MKEIFTMWKYTQMVVLVAVTAALYAGLMIPFKAIVLIPGFTELRPAVVVPVVFGLLFGPAGAWGAALGNVIGDLFGGMFGLSSAFGFVGNFLLGGVAYAVWGQLPFFPRDLPAGLGSARHVAQFALIVVVASLSCAAMIGFGVEVLRLLPFAFLAIIIAVNDILMPLLIGPALVALLSSRVQRWGLLWTDIMDEADRGWHIAPRLGAALIVIGGLGAFGAGLGTAISFYGTRVSALPQSPEGPLRLVVSPGYDNRLFGGEEATRSVTVKHETGEPVAVVARWTLTLGDERKEGNVTLEFRELPPKMVRWRAERGVEWRRTEGGVERVKGLPIAFQVPNVTRRTQGTLSVEASGGGQTATLELPVVALPAGTTRLGVAYASGAFLIVLLIGFLLL